MRRAASAAWRTAALASTRTALLPPPLRPAVVAARRSFSSTSPASFFFRKPQKTAHELANDLRDAMNKDRPDLLAKIYPQYVDSLSSSSSSSSAQQRLPLAQGELWGLMRFAARSGYAVLVRRIFEDIPSVHGFDHHGRDHHLLILALARAGQVDKAQDWLERMEHDYGIRPHISDWNTLLGAHRQKRDLAAMASVVHLMRRHGTEPNVVSYNTFISALFEDGKLAEVRLLVAEMQDRGVQGDVFTETALLTGFLDHGELASAREVQQRLAEAIAKGKRTTQADVGAVNALVKFEAADKDYRAALALAHKFRDVGVVLNDRTLSTLVVEGAKTVLTAQEGERLIDEVEALLPGVSAGRYGWAAVIKALVDRHRNVDEAFKVYHLARDRSVQPSALMVQPLLDTLFSPTSATPRGEALDAAKFLYDELAASRSRSLGPDTSIYATLLSACADPSSPDLAWSRTLIQDMKERKIRLTGRVVTSSIVALMRAAPSWDDAFSTYDHVRALDPSVLDLGSYNAILAGFTSLSPPEAGGEPAPAAFINEFFTDMRSSGHPPSATTYALLLTYYSRAASASPATIAHLHRLVKLDGNLDPDTALFNALMAAYSRTRAYGTVYRIWDSLVANSSASSLASSSAGSSSSSVQLDPTSLSILLDTCAWDGSLPAQARARRVWADLDAGRLVLPGGGRNRKNWDTWVEALARWGKWGEVEEVVFREMDGTREGVPRATRETVETVLKLARREGGETLRRLAEKVKHERADLWEEVREVAEAPRWEKGGRAEADGGKEAEQ
ncbi:hypothetical protein JCM8097_004521 [Rhodosporidiobolus ruineniae]